MRKNLCAHDNKLRSPNFTGAKWKALPCAVDIWSSAIAGKVCAAAARLAAGGVAAPSLIARHRELCSVREETKRCNALKWDGAFFLK